jgi:hypothetical protein
VSGQQQVEGREQQLQELVRRRDRGGGGWRWRRWWRPRAVVATARDDRTVGGGDVDVTWWGWRVADRRGDGGRGLANGATRLHRGARATRGTSETGKDVSRSATLPAPPVTAASSRRIWHRVTLW